MKKSLLFLLMSCFTIGLMAQSISGKVIDSNSGDPLIGASVVVVGTSTGTVTDFEGMFNLNVDKLPATLEVSYIGFQSSTLTVESGQTNLGEIKLSSGSLLDEVVVVGIADIAKDRKTPVAVSTLTSTDIIAKIGNQELPELLNETPSVYATKSGGGYGDSRINIRGFDQRNTAVMINGVPVNDMENGWVYWSNWAGLADVTSAMQVQRGLGSSKLAISSVGGTINVLTRTTDREKGGVVSVGIGNDGYLKTLASYSTGKMDNGFAVSALLSRTSGDGYVTGTSFEGYNYFLGVGYEKGNHNLQWTVTGAPQTHNQRTTSFFNMATLADYQERGEKYNFNHGTKDGDEFNWRKNFYHKPITSLNWDWKINDKSALSTVLYASVGRGGGTGDIGRLGGNYASSSKFRDANGEVMWDKIVASNSGVQTQFTDEFSYGNVVDPITGTFVVNDADLSADAIEGQTIARRNGVIRRASMNSHNWIGAISNFNHKLTNEITVDFGVDLRKYKGIHYRRVDDLLGADGYRDHDDVNNPFNVVTQEVDSDLGSLWNVFKSTDDDQKIDYYNEGLVNWAGVFTQIEYSKDALSAFVQAAASNQGYKRIDYFTYKNDDPNRETDYENILGGNIKGGANYNIDDNHNVFANVGFYSKQPLFDAIYLNYRNDLNENYENEKVLGMELGYGYRSGKLRANVNVYRTSWSDRFQTITAEVDVNNTPDNEDDDVEGTANISGITQVHTGLEVDASYKVSDMFNVVGMVSVGNWEYDGDASGDLFDDAQNKIGTGTLYLDGVKVGDAAQFTARLGVQVKPAKGLSIDASVRYADQLYAAISADDFDAPDHEGSLQLPSYYLADAGLSYFFPLKGKQSLSFRFNVNNLFNEKYIAESRTNIHAHDGDEVYDGINTRNKVFFGFGTTWNAGLRYNF